MPSSLPGSALNVFSLGGVPTGPRSRLIDLEPAGREAHARMLGHAATRRRRAAEADAHGLDASDLTYWKACAPAAVRKASAIRRASGFQPLP